MSRYIERDKLISNLKELPEQERIEYMGIYDCIRSQPTADVVEVVRCKDCIFYAPYELEGCEGQGNCSQLIGLDFCVEDDFFVDTVQEWTSRQNECH